MKIFNNRGIPERDRDIFYTVSDNEGVGVFEILSKSRIKEIMICKRILAKHFRNKGYTFKRIGKYLDVTHGAILNLLKK